MQIIQQTLHVSALKYWGEWMICPSNLQNLPLKKFREGKKKYITKIKQNIFIEIPWIPFIIWKFVFSFSQERKLWLFPAFLAIESYDFMFHTSYNVGTKLARLVLQGRISARPPQPHMHRLHGAATLTDQWKFKYAVVLLNRQLHYISGCTYYLTDITVLVTFSFCLWECWTYNPRESGHCSSHYMIYMCN